VPAGFRKFMRIVCSKISWLHATTCTALTRTPPRTRSITKTNSHPPTTFPLRYTSQSLKTTLSASIAFSISSTKQSLRSSSESYTSSPLPSRTIDIPRYFKGKRKQSALVHSCCHRHSRSLHFLGKKETRIRYSSCILRMTIANLQIQ